MKKRAYFLFATAREKMAELWRKSGRDPKKSTGSTVTLGLGFRV